MGTDRDPRRRARISRTPGGDERLAALAAEGGLPVEVLLREVADLRLALATDLTIAAAAVEAGEVEIAEAFVDGDRQAVADFHDRVRELIANRPAAPVEPVFDVVPLGATRRSRLRPGPLVAAAASVVFLLAGIVAGPRFSEPTHAPNQLALDAAARFVDFSRLVNSDASAAQIIAAGNKLHDSLESLVSQDPSATAILVTTLNDEQRLLLLAHFPNGTNAVLADARALIRRLRARAAADAVLDEVDTAPTAGPSAQPAANPKPASSTRAPSSPAATSSPKASAAPKASNTPSPTPSPTSTPFIWPPGGPHPLS